MHHIRYSLRHSTPHGTQPAAEGQHSIPHGAQPAVDRWHPPQHGVLPAAFGQYPNSTASSTQSIRIGFAMILQRPYGAESSRRPRFAGHQPCMHLHPANRQCHPPAQRVAFCAARHARHRLKPLIKKPAGTQMDPGRSADAEYVAGRAAWRPRQQHPRDAIASAVPARPRRRQQHPRGAIASAAPARPRRRPPARPCPRPRGLKALTARRCRRS